MKLFLLAAAVQANEEKNPGLCGPCKTNVDCRGEGPNPWMKCGSQGTCVCSPNWEDVNNDLGFYIN